MKSNTLQFGKAMSAALFVLLLVVAGSKNALAQNQVATLQHNDSLNAFYGMNALVEAHAAATDGDIITLSSGTFTKTDITKAITINGAGCVADTLGLNPTIVSGNFTIGVPNQTDCLTIQGVFFQGTATVSQILYNANFLKCIFNNLTRNSSSWDNGGMDHVQLINCLIGSANIRSTNDNVTIINCVIGSLLHRYWSYSSIVSTSMYVYNSIIGMARTGDFYSHNGNMYLYNSIISENVSGNERGQLYDCTAYNCIEIDSVFTSSVQTFNCMSVDAFSDVFETWNGVYSYDSDFHLNEEIVTSFLGNDGREVGIYGGAMPYNPRPSYLILNRCNVAPRSTVDGKLSVDIEVITGGE